MIFSISGTKVHFFLDICKFFCIFAPEIKKNCHNPQSTIALRAHNPHNMKRKTLIFINVLLGTLVTFFVGCKTHRVNKVEDVVDPSATEQVEPEPERMICLYGIPPEVYRRLHEQDSLRQDSLINAQEEPLQQL